MTFTVRAATRGSDLALWQARRVASLLEPLGVDVEPVVVSTHGDRRLDLPLSEIGGKGVFCSEVQSAVLDGRADIAVHSAKDLPSVTPDGLVLAAFPERGDPGDILVGARLDDLDDGATIATGAARRQSQLAWWRPDLRFEGLRGNIATRLECASRHPVVVAAAAIERLEIELSVPHERLDPVRLMIPQVGQGALAVECRATDDRTLELLAQLRIELVERTSAAERGFLAELGAGCDLPVAAHATSSGTDVHLHAMIASLDGSWREELERTGADPGQLGRSVATELLARLSTEQKATLAG